MKSFTGRNFEATLWLQKATLWLFAFESLFNIYASIKLCSLFFSISNCCAFPVDFFLQNYPNFVFFLYFFSNELDVQKNKALWRYKWASKCNKLQCSTFKIATCETFSKFQKKTVKLCIVEKNSKNKNDFFYHLLNLCTKFRSPRSNNKIFLNPPP